MTRDLPPAAIQVGMALTASAGGYLRTTVTEPWVTCSVCRAPARGYVRCAQCNIHVQSGAAVADRVATVVYAQKQAASGQTDQTYRAMYGYKAARPQRIHLQVVYSLLALAIRGHTRCDLMLAVDPDIMRWSTVPSTRNRPQEHPLHVPLSNLFAPGDELPVHTIQGATKDRAIRPQNYEVTAGVAPNTHVVIVDDSWVSGGSAQSVAVAVRNAGATSVSILAVARVLDPAWPQTAEFLQHGRLAADFDYTVCPWTGSSCP